MSVFETSLAKFFDRHERTVQVELRSVQGSSPRNTGTYMYVAADDMFGTIGGGKLEHLVIEHARMMLLEGVLADHLDIPLGPEIGQCCGGRVEVSLVRMSPRDRLNAINTAHKERQQYPHVYIMGAGHVGRAMADQMQFLPVHCVLIDSRADELTKCNAMVEQRLSAIPETDIRSAPKGSAFVILTHDHALDFLLAAEALERGDAIYVGMIGSKTKRAKFASWCQEVSNDLEVENLICPIGAGGCGDKRPSVIATFVAAEIMVRLTARPASSIEHKATDYSISEPSSMAEVDGKPKSQRVLRSNSDESSQQRPKLQN